MTGRLARHAPVFREIGGKKYGTFLEVELADKQGG
jgi:hypothetical protein